MLQCKSTHSCRSFTLFHFVREKSEPRRSNRNLTFDRSMNFYQCCRLVIELDSKYPDYCHNRNARCEYRVIQASTAWANEASLGLTAHCDLLLTQLKCHSLRSAPNFSLASPQHGSTNLLPDHHSAARCPRLLPGPHHRGHGHVASPAAAVALPASPVPHGAASRRSTAHVQQEPEAQRANGQRIAALKCLKDCVHVSNFWGHGEREHKRDSTRDLFWYVEVHSNHRQLLRYPITNA